MPGKDGKGFGTTTHAWYQDDGELDGEAELGSSPLESTSIVVTRTRNVTVN